MQVTFKLIRPEKSIEEKGEVFMVYAKSAFFLLIASCMTVLFQNIYIIFICLIILSFNSYFLIGWLHPGRAKQKDIIGSLSFDENGFNIREGNSNTRLGYQDLVRMELVFNYVQGYKLGPKDNTHNGLASIVFTAKNGRTHGLKFLMDELQQYHDFKPIMKEIYKHKVIVKERLGMGMKTVVLEFDHNYAKLQALKKELGVDRFYGH